MSEDIQREGFLAGEGDAWFRRNASHLAAPNPIRSRIAECLAAVLRDGDEALEIGCGNGAQLAALFARRRVTAVGVEPSLEAVAAGRFEHPKLALHVGTSESLPLSDASCDLVLFGFCLYLVDRALLARSVAEAGRVLRAQGWLAILDFDPPAPLRRPYHHRPGLWSWKADYSKLFLSDPAYHLVEKWSASHAGLGWHDDPNERIGFWLLRKDTSLAWPEATKL